MSGADEALAGELIEGRLTDPFAVLGPHQTADGAVVRTFQPGAQGVEVLARDDDRVLGTLQDSGGGLFAGSVSETAPYRFRIRWGHAVQETEDPYAFGLVLGD